MSKEKAKKLSKVFHSAIHDKIYGTTTIGARGQVVIPAAARKDMNLNPGDQLLVLSRFDRALGLIKADQVEEMVEALMKQWAGTEMQKVVENYAKKFFGGSFNKK